MNEQLIIEQSGNDCIVSMDNESRIIRNCNALKLAATMFNKIGVDNYTQQEMYDMGFGLK